MRISPNIHWIPTQPLPLKKQIHSTHSQVRWFFSCRVPPPALTLTLAAAALSCEQHTPIYFWTSVFRGECVLHIFSFCICQETEKYKYKSKEINVSWVGQSTIFKLPSPWLHAYVRVHVYVHFKLQHWANKSQTQLTSWAINLSRVVNSEICISADPTFQQVVKHCGQTLWWNCCSQRRKSWGSWIGWSCLSCP